MIYQLTEPDVSLFDGLRQNNYTRRIKSHFSAYGTAYDFCRFFEVDRDNEKYGIICIFNSSMMISSFENMTFDDEVLSETAGFIIMNKPAAVEFESRYAKALEELCESEYEGDRRTEFAFVAKHELPDLAVNELPALDEVYKILATCFPAIKNSYELWLTDTSHRVRRGLSQSFLLGNYTTATIQYIVDRVALVGHVGTIPEQRGKLHARKLLYWIGEKLTADGYDVRLFARPHRVSYYEEIGFKSCGVDLVLERKNFNE